jgi:hypothetical protein
LFELPLFVTFHSFARLEQTCNYPHHDAPPDLDRVRIIGVDCQPFCCQRAFALIPSERPSIPLKALLDCFFAKAAKQ